MYSVTMPARTEQRRDQPVSSRETAAVTAPRFRLISERDGHPVNVIIEVLEGFVGKQERYS